MQKCYSSRYVAKHLGVTNSTVINWVNRPFGAFPMPVVHMVDDEEGHRENLGWTRDQLPELRTWLAHRLNLTDPAAHWALIDSDGQPPGGHQGQGALFDEGTS